MKKAIIALVLVALIIGGAFLLNTKSSVVPVVATPAPSAGPQIYTLGEVAKHNNEASCWVAITGKVYDLTAWISQHPGGPDKILSICGTDGSVAFNGQHSGQRRPANELTNFYLGNLATK